MIKTENGKTEVIAQTTEELFRDTRDVITTFVKFSKRLQVPDEVIEKTLVQMIVDGFERGGNLVDLGGLFNAENKEDNKE